jgi:hypothetical protein
MQKLKIKLNDEVEIREVKNYVNAVYDAHHKTWHSGNSQQWGQYHHSLFVRMEFNGTC